LIWKIKGNEGSVIEVGLSKVFVIAEAGVNHNGDIEVAKNLIDVAADSRADAVKFQTFVAQKLVTRQSMLAPYQADPASPKGQLSLLEKLELSYEDHVSLMDYCRAKGIEFLSTPFDLHSLSLLERLGMSTIKIPSGEITNLPLLRALGRGDKKIILSTGMSTMQEIKQALHVLYSSGVEQEKTTVLHANTAYPTPACDVNLFAMKSMKDELNIAVGYSDHTLGIGVSIAAVALGATVIEKHFTLSRAMKGPDHKASLEPGELKLMVKEIRNVEQCLGSSVKSPTPSEQENISVVRKSIVASRPILKGELLNDHNLTTKRPGTGISPMNWDSVRGTRAIRNFAEDDLIET